MIHTEIVPAITPNKQELEMALTGAMVKLYRRSQMAEETGQVVIYKHFDHVRGNLEIAFRRTEDPAEIEAIKLFNPTARVLSDDELMQLFIAS